MKIAGFTRRHPLKVGGALIHPQDEGYAAFEVDAEYLKKHDPQPGGYYITYEDGYESYSPAAAFEEGYTRIGGSPHGEVGLCPDRQ